MVVVDRLSKYAHFAPLPTRFDALRVAHLFINTVVKHHGFPKTLVSDRDSVFLNSVWEELMGLSGTKLNFSTAYHPQSDGQTEVRNRGLEQYLRAFTADRPSKWSNFLPWAELALNCFYHEALGASPFQALYGREPPPLVASEPSLRTPPAVAALIRQRGLLLVELRKNLEIAQQKMRDNANRHRRHVEFNVGDRVLLKLQHYRQHSVAKPQSAKLSRRFYGPLEIIARIGQVAYRLKLPEGSRIHNVFHVSLLRPFVGSDQSTVISQLPEDCSSGKVFVKPVALKEKRILWRNDAALEHALLRWPDGSESWEPFSLVQQRFPDLLLEDKEVSNDGGVDTVTDQSNVIHDGEQPQEENAAAPSDQQQNIDRKSLTRPKRKTRPPNRLIDCASR